MRAYTSYKDIVKLLNKVNSIGLVPTMGSLHDGHLSLIKRASIENEKVIISIYVNPKQFNNTSDLKKYPRDIKNDLKMLKTFNNIIIYAPNDSDVYEKGEIIKKYEFGQILKIMEGKQRPGHFDGVATIIEKLLKMFKPNNAYFGEKDFQQILLVKILVKELKLDLNVISCQTIRESDGLAMSSRNKFLNKSERKSASQLIILLTKAKKMYSTSTSEVIRDIIFKDAMSIDNFQLEYFEILNISNLLNFFEYKNEIRAFIACKIGNTRLIDNIRI